jgi:hypothetical protein
MKTLATILVLLMSSAISLEAQSQSKIPSGLSAVERIRAKTPVTEVVVKDKVQLAGRYTANSEELQKRVGPFLEGNDLYLFPDGTYIYCEWDDEMAPTIFDKGSWSIAKGLIELKTDSDVAWKPRNERVYAVVRRVTHQDEIMLVGVNRGLRSFEKGAHGDPEFTLLTVSRVRSEGLEKSGAVKLKEKLMGEAWHPGFFKIVPPQK